MGTANFMYRDALFADTFECDCHLKAEENDEAYHGCDCASIYYDDLLDNVSSSIKQLDKNTAKKFTVTSRVYDDKRWDSERNFSGRILGKIEVSSSFFGLTINAIEDIIVRSGYYSGANIDRELSYDHDYCNTVELARDETFSDHADSLLEDLVYRRYMTQAQANYHRNNLIKRLEKMSEILWEKYLLIAKANATEYNVKARFSNGTTMYEKAA